jgi:hypothetical protein
MPPRRKLTVYQYLEFDPGTRLYRCASRYATEETIERLQGLVLRETALKVEAGRVDAQGFVAHDDAMDFIESLRRP